MVKPFYFYYFFLSSAQKITYFGQLYVSSFLLAMNTKLFPLSTWSSHTKIREELCCPFCAQAMVCADHWLCWSISYKKYFQPWFKISWNIISWFSYFFSINSVLFLTILTFLTSCFLFYYILVFYHFGFIWSYAYHLHFWHIFCFTNTPMCHDMPGFLTHELLSRLHDRFSMDWIYGKPKICMLKLNCLKQLRMNMGIFEGG